MILTPNETRALIKYNIEQLMSEIPTSVVTSAESRQQFEEQKKTFLETLDRLREHVREFRSWASTR